MMRRNVIILAICLFLMLPAESFAGSIRVLAVTPSAFAFAKNIISENGIVEMLVPPGTDVHDFNLKPSDVKKLRSFDAIIVSGLGLDDKIANSAQKAGCRVIDASLGISPVSGDPHVWLDPQLAIRQVENISDALADIDPAHAVAYRANSERYIKVLNDLDRECTAVLESLKGKYLITFHSGFGYFARRYGLKHLSLTGLSGGQATPAGMRTIYDAVRQYGVKGIFVEKGFSENRMKAMAKNLSVKVCVIDAMETGTPNVQYYEMTTRDNLKSIEGCLRGI